MLPELDPNRTVPVLRDNRAPGARPEARRRRAARPAAFGVRRRRGGRALGAPTVIKTA